MVKAVVKPVFVGYGRYREIEHLTPHKFFFCRYYSIYQRNSQAPSFNTQKELPGYLSRHREDLEKSFFDEQKGVFEKLHDCWSEYMSLAEAAIFEYAFKLGARLLLDSLGRIIETMKPVRYEKSYRLFVF